MALEHPPCWYVPRSPGASAADESVIVGVPAPRELSYIRFDNVRREAELSCTTPFHPDADGRWSAYPLRVEQDAQGYPVLYTEITIAGATIRCQLDTGSSRGLSLDQTTWTRLSSRLPHMTLTSGEDLYPYLGRMVCRHGALSHTEIGGRAVDRLRVKATLCA
jgi:hypothetical protein